MYDDKGASSREEITEKARDICERFISRLPYIQKMLLMDVQAGFDGDPAAKSKEDIIFSYPGLFAIYVYRIAHELYVQNVPFIPRIMTEYAHGKTGIDINSRCQHRTFISLLITVQVLLSVRQQRSVIMSSCTA